MPYPDSKDATPEHADYIVKIMTEKYCKTQLGRIQRCENAVTPDPNNCDIARTGFRKCEKDLGRQILKLCNPKFMSLTECMVKKGVPACTGEVDTMWACFKKNIKSGAAASKF
uniref:Uncharacterized protein n=2 Tax=Lotharella oceanica TaxID=641309 RepID=A0A7S2TL27_9EUKA